MTSEKSGRGYILRMGETPGSLARKKEKQASAQLRSRQNIDDQSNVQKLYKWATKERPFWTKPFTGEKSRSPYYDEPKK